MHFRILKMIATSGFLTVLECTKFDFGSAPPDSLAGLRGPTSEGREKKGMGKEGKERRGEVGEGQGTGGMEGKGQRIGMPGKGEGRRGEGRKERRRGRGGKKSKNTPSVNSCLRPWAYCTIC